MTKPLLRFALWTPVACLAFFISACLVQGLPPAFMQPIEWNWPKLQLLAFFLSSLAPAFFVLSGRNLSAWQVLTMTATVFAGIWYFANWLGQDIRPVGAVVLLIVAMLLNSCLTAVVQGRWKRLVPVIGLTALAGVVCLWLTPGLQVASRLFHGFSVPKKIELSTTAHPAVLQWFRAPFPVPALRGGGIVRLQDEIVAITGDGEFYHLVFSADGSRLEARPLGYEVPTNGQAFRVQGHEFRKFRVHGILFAEVKGSDLIDVYVAHPFFDEAEDCTTVRISTFATGKEEFLSGRAKPRWRALYDARPCLPTRVEGKKYYAGHQGGGRLQLLSADKLLLSVGDHSYDGLNHPHVASQDMEYDYGKILEIDRSSGSGRIISSGFRNPQGLHIDPQGLIWGTDHGPRGGDELNRVTDGSNFGWPYATYGVNYGEYTWPVEPGDRLLPTFKSPEMSWVPSVGISNLISIDRGVFERWHGDLVVGSMRAKTIFRVHMENSRPVFSEPIYVGERIRDLVLDVEGRIVFLADHGRIGLLAPLPDSAKAP